MNGHGTISSSITASRIAPSIASSRVNWVDHAKGICIILVVMMHSTLGVEKAFGLAEHSSWVGHFIAWARPFRMPDFFLISGLFLARRIAAPWRSYADTKIIHFVYFYILWMTIQFLTKGYGIYHEAGAFGLAREYAMGFVEPFGTLWFIYLLAVFFAVTKLLHGVPQTLIFIAAAVLEMAPVNTGWTLIDEFAARYVYFFAGYWMAEAIFTYAQGIAKRPLAIVLAALAVWALAEGVFVFGGVSHLPGIGLVLGFVGAAAVVAMGVLLSKVPAAEPIRYLGANSIVVYLAFFLFMAATRALLLRAAPGLGPDLIAVIVTAAGVIGPVVLHLAVKRTALNALFVRPRWAGLRPRVASDEQGWHSGPHEHTPAISQTETR
jgi:uncharacterized membrane protein YcfT